MAARCRGDSSSGEHHSGDGHCTLFIWTQSGHYCPKTFEMDKGLKEIKVETPGIKPSVFGFACQHSTH